MHPVKWFFTNRFIHLRAFLEPPSGHRCVPDDLAERIQRRLRTAVRFARVRVVLYTLLYVGTIAPLAAVAVSGISSQLGSPLFDVFGTVVSTILTIAAALVLLAAVAVLPVNRTLSLLEADILALGMEVVSRNVQADGMLPSGLHVGDEEE